MILEPWKSAEEIERRLSALNDPELEELLKAVNRGLLGNDPESYISPEAPHWKRRIGFIALAGLLAMSAGYATIVNTSHSNVRPKPHAALPAPQSRHPKVAVRHRAVTHYVAAVVHPAIVAPAPVHAASVAAPDETQLRQARAQLLHERVIAAQARAETARAQRQAKLALQQQADAQAWAQAEALAQARAEAVAQARAEALAREQAQEAARQNAADQSTKPADTQPPDSGRTSTWPSGGMPIPMPGPIDRNCTPHRGGLFNAVLDHVRVGGTNVGGLLRLIRP